MRSVFICSQATFLLVKCGLNTPSFFFVASLTNVIHVKNKGHNVRTKSAA